MALLLTLLLLTGEARAWGDPSPTMMGMGGAGLACPRDLGGVQRAPAALLLEGRYAMGLAGELATGGGPGGQATFSAWDASTSAVGAAVGVQHRWLVRPPTPDELPGWVPAAASVADEVLEENRVVGVLGYGFASVPITNHPGLTAYRRFGLALAGTWDREDSERRGVSDVFDLDVSLAGRPAQTVAVAAVGHGLLPFDGAAPWVEAGAWWELTPTLYLATDGAWDPGRATLPWTGQAGLAWIAREKVALRAGYAFNPRDELRPEDDLLAHRVGAGLGLASPQGGLDYGVTVQVAGPRPGASEHALSLVLYF